MLHDGLAYLMENLVTTGQSRMFPPGDNGKNSDACNVQYGAAGVLAVLTRADVLDPLAGHGGDGIVLRETVARVANWIDQRLTSVPKLLPGLYFGRAGTAWALYDAARHLRDDALAERALMLARALPVRWPNPDVCHGAAGAGFTFLHLWHVTGDPQWRQRVDDCVDGLLEAAMTSDSGHLHWPVPSSFDSKLAGVNHYGFAHGVAGVGSFLLAAGTAIGRDDAVKAARQAGDTLLAGAVREHGGAYWPNNVGAPRPEEDLRYHWCSGASGVGTFLVRLGRASGDQGYLGLAHEAAVMVHRGRWVSGTSVCHGLAGSGEFLLDMADAVGGDYRAWAEELAGCLYASHAVRDGRMIAPDEANAAANLSYNTGLSGVVGFLLRLQHGGPRWWMADSAWDTAAGGAVAPVDDAQPTRA
jgi:lantibiotic modifying enzyme